MVYIRENKVCKFPYDNCMAWCRGFSFIGVFCFERDFYRTAKQDFHAEKNWSKKEVYCGNVRI